MGAIKSLKKYNIVSLNIHQRPRCFQSPYNRFHVFVGLAVKGRLRILMITGRQMKKLA